MKTAHLTAMVLVNLFSVTSHGNVAVCWLEAFLAQACRLGCYGKDTKTVSEKAVLRQSRVRIPSLCANHTQRIPQSHPTVPRRRTGDRCRADDKQANHQSNGRQTKQLELVVAEQLFYALLFLWFWLLRRIPQRD